MPSSQTPGRTHSPALWILMEPYDDRHRTPAEHHPANGPHHLSGPLTFSVCVGTTQTISVEWEDRLCDQLENVLGEWVHTMNRRKLSRLLG